MNFVNFRRTKRILFTHPIAKKRASSANFQRIKYKFTQQTRKKSRFLVKQMYATELARFKPSGFNCGLNQVVFFLKKPIGFFLVFSPS